MRPSKEETRARVAKTDRYYPSWEGCESWTESDFAKAFRKAMAFYSEKYKGRDLKPQILEWITARNVDEELVQRFRESRDSQIGITVGAVAACLLKGMPECHPLFNNGRNTADWLLKEVVAIANTRSFLDDDDDDISVAPKPRVPIEERIKQQAWEMAGEIDLAVEKFMADPATDFTLKVNVLLRTQQCKPAHAKLIKNLYTDSVAVLHLLLSDQADSQLKEGYSHLGKRAIKRLLDFYAAVNTACNDIIMTSDTKKPKAIAIKPAAQLVKALQYCKAHSATNTASIEPQKIVGAVGLVAYNTRTRKLGVYHANNKEGLSVKGNYITNYNEATSFQRMLNEPTEQLAQAKRLQTPTQFNNWFNKLPTVNIVLTGRINSDIILLGILK